MLRHLRARGHQPGNRPDGGADGLGAHRLHHRTGAAGRHRPRRLPGNRHHRHHPAGNQAQLPGDGRARRCARHQGSLLHRPHRPPRPRPHRRAEGRAGRREDRIPVAGRGGPARLLPARRAGPAAGARRRRPDQPGGAAGDPGRPRRADLPGVGRAAGAGGESADPGDHHAAGHRRDVHRARAEPGNARDARHGLRQPGHRPLRPGDLPGGAVRRPGDRTAQRLCARSQDRSRRRRPHRVQQERGGRRPGAGRPQGQPARADTHGGIQRAPGLDQGNGHAAGGASVAVHPQVGRAAAPAGDEADFRRDQRRGHHRDRRRASTRCGPRSTTATRNRTR